MQTHLFFTTHLGGMADLLHPRPTQLPKTGDQSLDRFIYHLFDALHFFETVDPYNASGDPRKPYLQRADRVLQKYAGVRYQELRAQTPVHELSDEDYALVTGAIKGRLFDFRARLYLAALDACEQEGISVPELLPKIRDAIIPPIKKEAHEPTFEILVKYLNVLPDSEHHPVPPSSRRVS